MTRKKVVVVGGGVTGLTVAYRLTRARERFDVTLLEARSRLGGNIATHHEGSFTIEEGPDSFVLTKPEGRQLCEELGLKERLIDTIEANRKVYIANEGELHALPEGMVLGVPTRFGPLAKSGLFSAAGKARMSADLFLPKRKASSDESIGHFMRRRLGDEALDRLAEPMLAGIYMGDVDRLSLRATFPQLAALEDEHRSVIKGALALRKRRAAAKNDDGGEKRAAPSMFNSLVGGMSELIATLEREVRSAGGGILLRAPVSAVKARPSGGFVVEAGLRPNDFAIECDDVVMCAPAHAAARAMRPLDESIAADLRAIPYLSSATIVLAYRRDAIGFALDATGVLFPRGAGRSVLGITFVSSKWPHRAPETHALVRCYAGGFRDPGATEKRDEDLVAMAKKDVREILHVTEEPELAKVYRFPDANAQPVLGHKERVARIERSAARYAGLHFAGAAFDGVGIPDCVRQANDVAKKILAT